MCSYSGNLYKTNITTNISQQNIHISVLNIYILNGEKEREREREIVTIKASKDEANIVSNKNQRKIKYNVYVLLNKFRKH